MSGRRSTVDLTAKEQEHVRSALQFLRVRMCGWMAVAKALHLQEVSVRQVGSGRRTVTPTMVFRVARLVQVPIDDLLAGKYPEPGICPRCGHRPPEISPSVP